MARNRRINHPGSYHHITARGVDRSAVFHDDGDRRQFLSLLGEARTRFGCQVLAFCLMTNHIHLTVRDDFGTLSRTQHFLNGVYAKRFNRKHGRTGHLFERRFWSSMLDSDSYLATCTTYVHRNPVEAGMVRKAEDYKWSSYPSYVGARSAPKFLNTSILLAQYGNDVGLLRSMTEQPVDDSSLCMQLRSNNPPAVLGSKPTRPDPQPMSRPTIDEHTLIPLEAVLAACAAAFNVDVSAVRTGTRGKNNPARGLAAHVAQRHAGHSLRDIALTLGLNSTAAASLASRRFADSLEKGHRQPLETALRILGLPIPSC